MRAFKKAGFDVAWDEIKGETVVINTCAFIKDAIDESLDAIMASLEAKREGRVKRVVVTGCLAQRFGDKLSSQLKDVDLLIGVNGLERVPGLLAEGKRGNLASRTPFVSYPERLDRVSYKHPHAAYIKIADGCSNRCSYCVIPFIKGDLRSRTVRDVLDEAKRLVDAGAVELNLIAQDTMNFGADRGERELMRLLAALERIDGVAWIRLNYLYPSHITDGFLSFMAGSEKILKYFDVPVQHVSDRVLRLMNRKTDSGGVRRVIETIGKKIKDPFLRTTVIVGFPGETEEDFEKLTSFFNEVPFHRIGIFPYSREEPAPASRLREQVPGRVITERVNALSALADGVMREMSAGFIDGVYAALLEGQDPQDPTITLARPWFFAPEIDGYILLYNKPGKPAGRFVDVRITDAIGPDLTGEIV